jgi:hypothetical protein
VATGAGGIATGRRNSRSSSPFTPVSPFMPVPPPPGSPRLIAGQGLPPLSPRSARSPGSGKRRNTSGGPGGCAFQPGVQLVGRKGGGSAAGTVGAQASSVPTLGLPPPASGGGGTGMTGEVVGDRREVKRPSLDRGGQFSMLSIGTSVTQGVIPGLPQPNSSCGSPMTGGSTPGTPSKRRRQRRRGGTADLPTPTPKTARTACTTPSTPGTPGSANVLTPHTAPVMGRSTGRHVRHQRHGRREPQSPYSGRMTPQSPLVPQPYSARLLSNIGFVGASTFNNISSFGMDMSPHVFGQRQPDDSPSMSICSDGSYMDGMMSGESSPCTPYSPATFADREPSSPAYGGLPMHPAGHMYSTGRGFGGIPGSPRLPPPHSTHLPLTPSYLSQHDGFHELAGVPIGTVAGSRGFHRNSRGETPGQEVRSGSPDSSTGSDDGESPLAGKSPFVKKDK